MSSNYSEHSDEELMGLYQMDDLRAFEELYSRHSAKVFGFIKSKVGELAANDIFQEVFMKLHRSRSKYDPEFPFVPWLFTVTRNSVIDFYRKRRIEEPLDDNEDPTLQPLSSSEEPGNLDDILSAMNAKLLSGREKEVLGLRFKEELSLGEIARKLQLSAPNVRKISSRALHKLKGFLGAKRES